MSDRADFSRKLKEKMGVAKVHAVECVDFEFDENDCSDDGL